MDDIILDIEITEDARFLERRKVLKRLSKGRRVCVCDMCWPKYNSMFNTVRSYQNIVVSRPSLDRLESLEKFSRNFPACRSLVERLIDEELSK